MIIPKIHTYLEQMVAWRLFKRATDRYEANESKLQMRKLHEEMAKTILRMSDPVKHLRAYT